MTTRLLFAPLALTTWLIASPAAAVDCATSKSGANAFITCRVAAKESLRIFYADSRKVRYASFARLRAALAREHQDLLFAMNAGMFHPDFRPVGLLVVDGRQIAPLNRAQASGNFYLQPNGVFLIDAAGPRVLATDEYRDLAPALATQSGPMLVHRGQIPDSSAFRATSRSRNVRNGVCVPKEGVAFVISEGAVTLREFALFFRDVLGCDEALYFDGAISSLYSPQIRRADARAELGPMIGVAK